MTSFLHISLLALVLCCVFSAIKASSDTPIQWAWMGGSITPHAVYGQQGVPSPSNVPSARYGATIWFDSLSQELWLFGGHAVGSSVVNGA